MLKRFDEFGHDLSRGPLTRDARAGTLRCAACRAVLSRQPERIAMRGAHRHHCVNPHGFHFEIGCFRRIGNCRASGASTTQDTWFPGYAWRIALCGACTAHVGWHFSSADDDFHGLILSRVTDE